MRVRWLYRIYEVSGQTARTVPPAIDLVYRNDEGVYWRRLRETKVHAVYITLLTLFVTVTFLIPIFSRMSFITFLIPIIPILMLAGEATELLIYNREGLSAEVHNDGLWVPTMAYTVVTWHVLPFEEIGRVKRSARGSKVSLRHHRRTFPIDIRELGEEGLRLMEEGIRGGLDGSDVPRLVLYDGPRHSG